MHPCGCLEGHQNEARHQTPLLVKSLVALCSRVPHSSCGQWTRNGPHLENCSTNTLILLCFCFWGDVMRWVKTSIRCAGSNKKNTLYFISELKVLNLRGCFIWMIYDHVTKLNKGISQNNSLYPLKVYIYDLCCWQWTDRWNSVTLSVVWKENINVVCTDAT